MDSTEVSEQKSFQVPALFAFETKHKETFMRINMNQYELMIKLVLCLFERKFHPISIHFYPTDPRLTERLRNVICFLEWVGASRFAPFGFSRRYVFVSAEVCVSSSFMCAKALTLILICFDSISK